MAVPIVIYMYLYSLAFMDHHAHLELSVIKRRPVHFILNPGHVEYELGVLLVWKLSQRLNPSGIRTHDIPHESRVH